MSRRATSPEHDGRGRAMWATGRAVVEGGIRCRGSSARTYERAAGTTWMKLCGATMDGAPPPQQRETEPQWRLVGAAARRPEAVQPKNSTR
ncbi:hypothetical protein VFPFJ_03829 [Purpureocillium lilacinum]|uniref:Uncharacterized protein n=1 Tax=Purpureocillium lilacinum TaxID=33203 RepID=A0A179GVQ1_PURLI|nr:hypothetical protein VFPFJ_03829 [Purpureocillium lilacinum]OAQ82037.1 hypothetical protein VFPBJ_04621 [Purpureocillium lilacinum]OAQ92089.1 hypothetical protein VFPFJ_03829 [Purpureocillium lilacinum]